MKRFPYVLKTCIFVLKLKTNICKSIYACLFSVHNTISLSRHEQICLSRL